MNNQIVGCILLGIVMIGIPAFFCLTTWLNMKYDKEEKK